MGSSLKSVSYAEGIRFEKRFFSNLMAWTNERQNIKQKHSIYNCNVVVSHSHFRVWRYSEPRYSYRSVQFSNLGKTYNCKENPFKTPSSIFKARNTIYDLIDMNKCDYTKFITFTFKDNVTSFDESTIYWKRFLIKFQREFGYSFKYLRVREFQKRGAIHFHVVCFNPEYIPFWTLKKIWSSSCSCGSIDIKTVDKVQNVSKYVSKYITKDCCSLPGRTKLYTCSRSLLRPLNFRFYWTTKFRSVYKDYRITYFKDYVNKIDGSSISYYFFEAIDCDSRSLFERVSERLGVVPTGTPPPQRYYDASAS